MSRTKASQHEVETEEVDSLLSNFKSIISKANPPCPSAQELFARIKTYDEEGYDDSDIDWEYEGYDESDEDVQTIYLFGRTFEIRKINMTAFWTLTILSILLTNAPGVSDVLTPVNQFVTMVHESCHAIASLATGGQPSMTIVGDGAGHAGLTQFNGGILFITAQAGYLGTAAFGSALIFLSQFHKISRYVLMAIGLTIIYCTLVFITPSVFSFTTWWSGLLSLAWGLALGWGCVILGSVLKPFLANLVLLFLAVQTALSSITLVWFLLPHSLGMAGQGFSDATVMQQHFFIPAPVWAISWILLSVGMVLLTLKFTYARAFKSAKR